MKVYNVAINRMALMDARRTTPLRQATKVIKKALSYEWVPFWKIEDAMLSIGLDCHADIVTDLTREQPVRCYRPHKRSMEAIGFSFYKPGDVACAVLMTWMLGIDLNRDKVLGEYADSIQAKPIVTRSELEVIWGMRRTTGKQPRMFAWLQHVDDHPLETPRVERMPNGMAAIMFSDLAGIYREIMCWRFNKDVDRALGESGVPPRDIKSIRHQVKALG